jgi:Kef-type K+ transport system membrane component KefB
MPTGADRLLLELFAIFVWAKIFGELFEQLSLPAVLGEILAGIILGPYATALITPSENIYAFAEIGAIFVLFTAGLETRPQDLIRVGRESLRVALAGVIVPFALGFLYMRLRGNPSHEAIFVAAAMVATSVGITARVLGDLRVMGARFARIIMGAAVFDDILGMVLLAIVVGMASGTGVRWVHMGIILSEAVGFAVFMIFFGPRIVHRMEPGLNRMSTQNAPLVLSLALCLLLSWASAKIGMAAIIGAFFAGLVLADYAPQWDLQPRVSAINEFLAPFFFFTIGARLNVRLFSGDLLVAAIVISLLAIASKVLGCGLPLLREGWPTVLRVGVGMMPRGEVALIVALVGLQMKMVSSSAYAIVIFMAGTTTLLAPPLLRFLLRSDMQAEAALAAARGERRLFERRARD